MTTEESSWSSWPRSRKMRGFISSHFLRLPQEIIPLRRNGRKVVVFPAQHRDIESGILFSEKYNRPHLIVPFILLSLDSTLQPLRRFSSYPYVSIHLET